jgi:hypothetical protein
MHTLHDSTERTIVSSSMINQKTINKSFLPSIPNRTKLRLAPEVMFVGMRASGNGPLYVDYSNTVSFQDGNNFVAPVKVSIDYVNRSLTIDTQSYAVHYSRDV